MKKKSDFLNKGVLLALILIVVDLIGGFAHLRFETWFKWIGTILMLILIIVFCIQYGKQRTEGVTFGSVFGYGFKIALVVSIIIMVYSLLSVYVIFPEYIDQMLVQTRTSLEAKGGMSEEQIDGAIAMTKKFTTPPIDCHIFFSGNTFFRYPFSIAGRSFYKEK